ncbi:carbohydrate ABC transporter permease [Microbacterium sp. NPDC028030]|uniref:carbohydrate ABC transporter permease n=1 Tax=Microbacterium sp. NPDC028030 TaxID=3155124 RepID=UPI0033C86C8B
MINRYTGRTLSLEIALWALAAVFLLPLFALVNLSLKAPHNPTGAFVIAGQYSVENFGRAWQDGHLGAALMNSAVVAVASILLVLVAASLAAYPLARLGSRWSRGMFYLFMIGLVVPAQLGVLPLFLSMRDLGLNGSLLSVILAGAGSSIPFAVFIITMFLRETPRDFEEAASLDGCGPIRTFWHIVVPLLRPAIGTVAILNVISIWNSFFIPLLFLSGTGNETLPVRISGFVRTYYADWPAVFAALLISAAPILIAYFLLQKYIIQGFAGGLKG